MVKNSYEYWKAGKRQWLVVKKLEAAAQRVTRVKLKMVKSVLGLLALAVIIAITGYAPPFKKNWAFVSIGIVFIFVGAMLGHLFGRSALDVVLLHDRSYLTLITPVIGYMFIILGMVGIFKSKFAAVGGRPPKIGKP